MHILLNLWQILFWLFATPLLLIAQNEHYTNYTIKDGLSSNHIYSIAQDSNGIIWLATENGLCSFDGEEFDCFGSVLALDNLEFLEVTIDLQGRIWLSSLSHSPFYFSNGKIHHLRKIKTSSNQTIFTIKVKNEEELYIIGGNYYYTLNSESLEIKSIDTLHDSAVRYFRKLSRTGFSSFFEDKYVGMERMRNKFSLNSGIKLDGTKEITVEPFLEQYQAVFDNLALIKHGKYIEDNTYFWGRTNSGLVKIDLTDDDLNYRILLPNKNIYSIFRDRDENLWIGTKRSGLFLKHEQSISLKPNAQLDTKFFPSNIDDLYILDSCIYLINNNKLLIFNNRLQLTDSILSDDIFNILEVKKQGNNTLILTGVNIKKNIANTNRSIPLLNTQKPEILKSLLVLDSNRIIAFSSRGLLLEDDEITDTINISPSASIKHSIALKGSVLFMGSMHGLFQYQINESHSSTQVDTHPINKLLRYHDNEFIYCSPTTGVFLATMEGHQFSKRHLHTPTSPIIDAELLGGKLYLATHKGITTLALPSFDFEKFSPVSNYTSLQSIHSFDGKLLVASTNSLQLIHPNSFDNDDVSDLVIKAFIVDGRPHDLEENQILESNQNDIKVDFSYPKYAYSHPSFKYRLLPVQNDYTNTNSKSISLINLRPGKYKLEILATTASQINSKIKSVEFVIKTPWWNSWWFYIICVLSFLFIMLYFIRQARIRDKSRLNLIQQRLNTIHAQMNPHFIFNALQSLHYFIKHNEREKASSYLISFSTLLRKTLDTSINDIISIQDEIEYLKSYLQLEHDKFDNRLVFDIIIDSRISLKSRIPSMLIQPFVENAIIHGFTEIKRINKLKIELKHDGSDQIMCIIADNGKGISQLNNSSRDHKSFATNAINKKLKLLTQLHSIHQRDQKTEIKVENNLNKKSSIFTQGTTVTMAIPIIKEPRK